MCIRDRNKILLKNWVCDKFIGISNAVAGDIVAAGIDEKKVVRVYNGIEKMCIRDRAGTDPSQRSFL